MRGLTRQAGLQPPGCRRLAGYLACVRFYVGCIAPPSWASPVPSPLPRANCPWAWQVLARSACCAWPGPRLLGSLAVVRYHFPLLPPQQSPCMHVGLRSCAGGLAQAVSIHNQQIRICSPALVMSTYCAEWMAHHLRSYAGGEAPACNRAGQACMHQPVACTCTLESGHVSVQGLPGVRPAGHCLGCHQLRSTRQLCSHARAHLTVKEILAELSSTGTRHDTRNKHVSVEEVHANAGLVVIAECLSLWPGV